MNIKYICPTPNEEVRLSAKIKSYSDKKVFINCNLYSGKVNTAVAEVIAFRVYDSSLKINNGFGA